MHFLIFSRSSRKNGCTQSMHRLFFCSDFKSSGLFARSVLESKNGKELRLHYVCKGETTIPMPLLGYVKIWVWLVKGFALIFNAIITLLSGFVNPFLGFFKTFLSVGVRHTEEETPRIKRPFAYRLGYYPFGNCIIS